MGTALMGVPVRRRVRVDRHAADRIDGAAGLRKILPILTAVIMTALRMAAVIVRVLVHGRSSSCALIPCGGIYATCASNPRRHAFVASTGSRARCAGSP